MDNNEVKALRQRLKRAGYTNISIYDEMNGYYSIQAKAPDGKWQKSVRKLLELSSLPYEKRIYSI